MEKPPLRVMCNLPRVGGTIIGKCLGCMRNIVLLSEIHPAGSRQYNPLIQAQEWHNLITAADLHNKQFPFAEAIGLINERSVASGKKLVIRDWAYLDYFHTPWTGKPTY